ACLFQGLRNKCDRACRIDEVIDDDTFFAIYFPDDVHYFCYVRFWTTFIDDGQWSTEELGQFTGTRDTPVVRRDNNWFLLGIIVDQEVISKQRSSQQVIDRDRSEEH